MLEFAEFDCNVVLKSFSEQDIALEQSCQQRVENDNIYQTTLQNNKEAQKEFELITEERQILYAKFTEKLDIKNSFNQLQGIPNCRIKTNQNEILDLYEKMSKYSDDFVNSVNTFVTKFQNLGTEFDESAILKNKADCTKKIELLVHEIKDKEDKFNSLKQSEKEYEYNMAVHNLKKAINRLSGEAEMLKMRTEIFENEQQLLFLSKNVEFLKQRNHEFEIQCAAFGN